MKNIRMNNSILSVGNNTNNIINLNTDSDLDWAQLENGFIELIYNYSNPSKEFDIFKNGLNYTFRKDKAGLVDFIKQHSVVFATALTSNVAGVFITDFIKNILHIK